jgi:hypothetical protein
MQPQLAEEKEASHVGSCHVGDARAHIPVLMQWYPQHGERFLGYNYHYGRQSNHIYSLANAISFAALLNR